MLPERTVCWVTEAIGRGSRIASIRHLPLGGWHVNHAVDVIDACGHRQRLVLRRWARAGWQVDDPDYTAERETRVLGVLRATPVPAPIVVAADPLGARADVSALLLTRLPGHPPRRAEDDDFCWELAATLAQIHDVDGGVKHQLEPYRLYYNRAAATPARWMPKTAVWAAATAAVREQPPAAPMALIHRDYHPENTLWSRRRLTGVVDWTQASWGPLALDLGHMRWNLVADHGQRVADRFLASYQAVTGRLLGHQPYWDLVSLFDLLLDGDGPGDITPADLSQFEDYAGNLMVAPQ